MSESGGSPALVVVPDDVSALGKYAYDLADILRASLTNAGRDVESLTKGGWTGSAADSFAAGWSECRDGGQKIIDALATLASTLGVTAESYGAHDNQFAAEIPKLNMS
ncbi:WXG100 family type VII secretion target [Nocardia sp. NPDC051570]|uniref:WXG100 family type VII secretion target n=1 Tax=Nocardia sp. NPDC051570 TaxID=3364324 RepID=UPI0037B3151D